MTFVFDDLALHESNAISEYINARRPGHGDRYLLELRRVVDRICRLPRSCPRLPNSHGREVHRAYLHRYKYMVDYQILNETFIVLAITYATRKRTPWRKRML